jgi:outer membrane beta-barrel protein
LAHPIFTRVAAACLPVALAVVAAPGARAQCVDEALREQLVGQRAYRGVVERKIQKALRHEVGPLGGWYAADLSDGAPIWGGAYTFHFTEELGLEASYLRARRSSDLYNEVIDRHQGQLQLTREQDVDVQLFMGHMVWSLAYGKVRWLGGGIGRFDFHVALGAGAVDAPGGRVAGSAGIGMKFYFTEWLDLRLDFRDLVHGQRAPLGYERVVNDLSATAGIGVFFPFSQ